MSKEFAKFIIVSFDLYNSYRSERTTDFYNETFRVKVEANPIHTFEKLLNNLNQTSSTIRKCLQRIGKVCMQVFGFGIMCAKKTKLAHSPHAIYCFNGIIPTKRFSIAWSIEKKKWVVSDK